MSVKPIVQMKDYGFMPYKSNSIDYVSMIQEVPEKSQFDQASEKHSEFKRPYNNRNYIKMEYLYDPPNRFYPDDGSGVVPESPFVTGPTAPTAAGPGIAAAYATHWCTGSVHMLLEDTTARVLYETSNCSNHWTAFGCGKKTSGKWYIGYTGSFSFYDVFVGFGQYYANTTYPGGNGVSCGIQAKIGFLYPGGGSGTGNVAAGSNYGFAIDIDNQKAYIKVDGAWQNGADPDTDSNPNLYNFPIGSGIYPICGICRRYNQGSDETGKWATMNFAGAPSNYSTWTTDDE